MSGQINPSPIARQHFRALRTSDGHLGRAVLVEHAGIPVMLGIAALMLDLHLRTEAAVAILTVAGLFSAFFFQLAVAQLERAESLTDLKLAPSRERTSRTRVLESISANASYAALLSAATAALALATVLADSGWPHRVSVALTVAAGAHLIVTLLVVMRRTFVLTMTRLRDVRTSEVDTDADFHQV